MLSPVLVSRAAAAVSPPARGFRGLVAGKEFTLTLRLLNRRRHALQPTVDADRPFKVPVHDQAANPALGLDDHEPVRVDHQVVHLSSLAVVLDPQIVQNRDVRRRPEGSLQIERHLPLRGVAGPEPRVVVVGGGFDLHDHRLKIPRRVGGLESR